LNEFAVGNKQHHSGHAAYRVIATSTQDGDGTAQGYLFIPFYFLVVF
jgi:hypothetical protein